MCYNTADVVHLHNDELHVVLLDLVCDFCDRVWICIQGPLSVCDKNNLPFILQFFAVLCNHLDCNDDRRDSFKTVSFLACCKELQPLPSPLSVLLRTILLRSCFKSGRRILNGLGDTIQEEGETMTHLLISWSTEICSKLSSSSSSFAVPSRTSINH